MMPPDEKSAVIRPLLRVWVGATGDAKPQGNEVRIDVQSVIVMTVLNLLITRDLSDLLPGTSVL